jgi:ribosomal-protein-alanine N-acetyltransferase
MAGNVLITPRLVIRELPPAAAPTVAAFLKENWHFHRAWEPFRDNGYFSTKEQRKRLRFARSTGDAIHFWVLLRETGSRGNGWRDKPLIGSVTVTSIIRGFFQNAFLGYKVDARHARRGYMSEAIAEVLDYAFHTLELHRIEANVMPSNVASRAMLEKLGFRDEGIAKDYLKIQGRWEDHTHMVLLSDEWRR